MTLSLRSGASHAGRGRLAGVVVGSEELPMTMTGLMLRWLVRVTPVLGTVAAAADTPTRAVATAGALYGGLRSLEVEQGAVRMEGPLGLAFRAGLEFGDTVNNEFSLQVTWGKGRAALVGTELSMEFSVLTIGLGYSISFDIPSKQGIAGSGIAPHIGVGVRTGGASFDASATLGDQRLFGRGAVIYFEIHAVAGVRWTGKSGLAIRAELVFSTYGGLLAWIPSVGVAYEV